MLRYFTLLLLFFTSSFSGQNSRIDSILHEVTIAKQDTSLVKLYNSLGKEYIRLNDHSKIEQYSEKAIELSKKINYKRGESVALRNLGVIYDEKGDYPKALEYYNNAYLISKDLAIEALQADILTLVASIYTKKAEYNKSIELNIQVLRLRDKISERSPDDLSNLNGKADAVNNIGNIYYYQGKYSEALEYYKKALSLYERSKDEIRLAAGYNNVGLIYRMMEKPETSLEYRKKALKIYEKINNKEGLFTVNLGIGILYFQNKNLNKALEYHLKALDISRQVGERSWEATTLHNLGEILTEKGDKGAAIQYLDKALAISQKTGDRNLIMENYKARYSYYEKAGNYKTAFEYQNKYLLLKDSILGSESSRQINELNAKYETEKKEKQILELNKQKLSDSLQLAQKEVESERQNSRIIFLLVSLILISVVGIFIFISLRNKQKVNKIIFEQKAQVEYQKELVEEKQKEIIDSIVYARRIQKSLLPTEKYIERNLKRLKK